MGQGRDIEDIIRDLRERMAAGLQSGMPLGGIGRVLADAEEELDRHRAAVATIADRASRIASGDPTPRASAQGFFDRPRPAGLDDRASRPEWLPLTPDQVERNVAFAFKSANPTFCRDVIDRLLPGEKVRNVTTNHKWYEYTREQFERLLPGIAASDSYQKGTASAPGKARYVTGRPPEVMDQMLAPDWQPG